MSTYRAVQVTSPGKIELVNRPLSDPGAGRVRLRVEACGICHTDSVTMDGLMPGIAYPRVPGHEVVGRIDALGEGVSGWKIGQRVGVGLLAGHCGVCTSCRRGDFVTCTNQPFSGVHQDGGYAESMIAIPSGLASIPDDLESVDAAPLLCAGITTFNALRHSLAEPGDLVAVQGIGGLGHLGVQFAARMGFRVVAIARGGEKGPFAKELGAHHYIDSTAGDPATALQALGGARVILATASDSKSMSELIGGLAPRGRMIVAGAGSSPIEVSPMHLLFGSRGIEGTLTGSAIDNEDTLAFSVLQRIKAIIETVPLEKAAEGYQRMLSNKARFRMVIVTGQ
ncbi:MAG TPA: alcohol dehydrogenase [Planctomycetaceae bacterium]|jgi:D-arabinose 1-dehydrogenase-like Zn-dependent alcohol dehydrogenase|nr:alcohol dehydrogenase [Planctomycetaceae bacterium]